MNRLRRSFLIAVVAAILVPARAVAWDLSSLWNAVRLKKDPPKPSQPWGHSKVTPGSKGYGYNTTNARVAGYDATRPLSSTAKGKTAH